MNSQISSPVLPLRTLALLVLLFGAALAQAQTPVDEDGNPVGSVYADDDIGEVTLLGAAELQALVGPIALYPDDLLAIVLPASTYPLEIVQAARFLEDAEDNSELQPDEAWDDSVVALLNYPEVVQMLNDDIDWTWRLGEAVVAQQADVVAAVEAFRDRAYAAGNLKSDERQTVTRSDDNVIEIDPVEDDVIYVPYYEPASVVVRQTRPVYYYYPRAYPVYYYPYPAGHRFAIDYFWGVTTVFRVGWVSDHLHVHHHSYHGHPYYGWNYYGSYWRRPSVHVFNRWYGGYRDSAYRNRYGHYWRPRRHGGARPGYSQVRNRYYTDRSRSRSDSGYAREQRRDQRQQLRRDSGTDRGDASGRRFADRGADRREDRRANREQNRRAAGGDRATNRSAGRQGAADRGAREPIRFRARDNVNTRRGDERRASRGAPVERADRTRRTTTASAQPRRAGSSGNNTVRSNRARPQEASQRRRAAGSFEQRRPQSAPSSVRRQAVQRSTSSQRRAAPAPRSAPVQRAAPARRAAPVQRSAPARRAAPTSRSAPVQRAPAASNRAPRNAGNPRSSNRGSSRKTERRGNDRRRSQ